MLDALRPQRRPSAPPTSSSRQIVGLMFWLFVGGIFSTLGGLLGALIFKKQTPPGVIDIPARPRTVVPRVAQALHASCASLSHIAHRAEIWDVECSSPVGAACVLLVRCRRWRRPPAAPSADADAAADPARRARARRRSRQPHVHADVRAAGAGQGSAAAARPRHQPERRPRSRRSTASFIGELKNVTVRQALGLILPPLGLDYALDGGVIRVFRREPETRIFDINYIAAERAGAGDASAATADRAAAPASRPRRRPTCSTSSPNGVPHAAVRARDVQRRSQGRPAAGDRFPRAARSRRRSISTRCRIACTGRCRSTRGSSRSSRPTTRPAGIDWAGVAAKMSGAATADAPATRPTMNGLRVTDVGKLLALLGEQGKVTDRREPAAADAEQRAVDRPHRRDELQRDAADLRRLGADLSLTPIVKAPTAVGVGHARARRRRRDAGRLRLHPRSRDRRSRRRSASSGGWFGRPTVVTRKHVELVILLTPKIVRRRGGAVTCTRPITDSRRSRSA